MFVLCPKLVLIFVLIQVTLGRSMLGPPQPGQAGRRRKQDLGVCDEVWTPCRGQSSNALYPKGLESFSPVLASIQVGRKGVRKGDHSSLVVRARQGARGQSFKRNPDGQQELAGGRYARNWAYTKSRGPKSNHQASKGNARSVRSRVVHRTLVPCINHHDWGSTGEAKIECYSSLAGWIPGLQAARLIPRPTQGWQYLSMLSNLLGSTYFYVLKMRIHSGWRVL